MLTIGHCIHGLGLGGAQQVVKLLAQGGDRDRYRHFVYAGHPGVFRAEIEAAATGVRVMPRRLPKFDPIWLASLADAMKRDGIDVVHTHLFGDTLHGHIAAKMAGNLPSVITLHNGTQNFSWIQRFGYRWLLPRSTRVVAVSGSVRQSFAAYLGADCPHISVIPNGIDVESIQEPSRNDARTARERLGISQNARVVAAIGRMVEQKGFNYLIDAFAQLESADELDAHLVMLGDGPLLGTLEAQAKSRGIAHRVVFTGFRSDVKALLPAFDVVAFSSLYEGLPVALLEAMAASRCIVATEVPGLTDVLQDEETALLVQSRSPRDLSVALDRTLRDPLLRSRLGVRGRKHLLAELTSTQMVERYHELYEEIRNGIVPGAMADAGGGSAEFAA